MRHIKIIVLALSLIAFPKIAFSITVKPKSFDDLIIESDEVIQGRVSKIESRRGEGQFSRHIFTYVHFENIEQIKSDDSAVKNSYTLRISGGQVGNRVQYFPGVPQFKLGHEYVIFVRGNGKELFPLVGVHQGMYEVISEGEERIIKSLGESTPILRTVSERRALGQSKTNEGHRSSFSTRVTVSDFKAQIRNKWQQLAPATESATGAP